MDRKTGSSTVTVAELVAFGFDDGTFWCYDRQKKWDPDVLILKSLQQMFHPEDLQKFVDFFGIERVYRVFRSNREKVAPHIYRLVMYHLCEIGGDEIRSRFEEEELALFREEEKRRIERWGKIEVIKDEHERT
jgi:hypothetical protein